jgi:hypothetical protein
VTHLGFKGIASKLLQLRPKFVKGDILFAGDGRDGREYEY